MSDPAADRFDTVAAGADAAGALLHQCCGISVRKALNLRTKAGHDKAVAAFAAKLRTLAQASERDAVAAAVRLLDIDWKTTTPAQRRQLINDALVAAGRAMAVIPAEHAVVVEVQAREVVAAGRSDVIRSVGTIGADFNALDDRIVEHLRSSHVLYVTDEYGRRVEAFGSAARDIVANGVEAGAGRAAIAEKLKAAATQDLAGRSRFYWEVVSAAFTTRGRSFAQVSGYAEAGIERFQIMAVLDEATTNFCRAIHGTEFTVGDGLRAFAEAERLSDPESIKESAPWVRETRNGDGTIDMWVKHNGAKVSVGRVLSSAVGRADETGKFSGLRDSAGLRAVGVSLPPYHGLCRTTTVPVL